MVMLWLLVIVDDLDVEGIALRPSEADAQRVFTGKVVKRDIGNDLALISVDEQGTPVGFANTIVKVGEPVEAIGHPQGFFFSVSRGIVSAVRQLKGALAPGGGKTLVIQTDTRSIQAIRVGRFTSTAKLSASIRSSSRAPKG
jgi:S1-C subfamily serine protease